MIIAILSKRAPNARARLASHGWSIMGKHLLTPEERVRIRAIRRANPKLTYREIGLQFGVSDCTIWTVCNKPDPVVRQMERAVPPPPRKVTMALPKSARAAPQLPPSMIPPIPLCRLMGRRA